MMLDVNDIISILPKIAARYAARSNDLDVNELVNEAWIRGSKRGKTYKTVKFACWKARMDMVDYIRNKYKLNCKNVPDFVVLNENNAIDHDDTSGIEARDIVELLKKELSPENLEFLSLYYMEENLLREIAANRGTTEAGESWRGIRMLDKCREILGLDKVYNEYLRRDVVVNIE